MSPKALSRTIKFRAWDKTKKKMVMPGDVVEESELMITFSGDITEEHNNHACGDDECCGPNENYTVENNAQYELMQFTGLLDKNGKKIFEGDIVKFLYKNCIPEETRTAEVNPHRIGDGGLYNNVCAYYPFVYTIAGSYKDDGRQTAECYLTPPSECEIIGNIYESPELLTKENE